MNSQLIKNRIELLAEELEKNNTVLFGHIENARNSLLQYKDILVESERELPADKGFYADIDPSVFREEAVNCNKVVTELRRIDGSFDLVLRLLRQRVISREEITDQEMTIIKILERKKLLTTIKVHREELETIYYTLSGRGLNVLNDKEARKKLRSIDSRYTPAWCCYGVRDVSENMLIQAVRLNNYFKCIGHADYITFNLVETDNLLLACRIEKTSKTNYICSPEISDFCESGKGIKRLCKNGKLDSLTIAGYTQEDIGIMKESIDIDASHKTKLYFFNLEEPHEQ